MASAASSGPSLWSRFRSQAWPVQLIVWLFALPVPVWLWASQRTSDRGPALALACIVTLGCIAVPITSALSDPEPAPPPDRATPTTRPDPTDSESTTTASTAPEPTSTTPPTTVAATVAPPSGSSGQSVTPRTINADATAAELLSQVRVADETSDSGYDSSLFATWTDADDDDCDTRCEVLGSERLPAVPGLANGGWISTYDNITTDDPSTLDIDHVVALAEAWRSGAATWDTPTRDAFANDLADPRSLAAVTASSNRSKSDTDPSGWRPDDQSGWCRYIANWMAVKLRWNLAVDPIEFAALQNITDTC